MINGWIHTLSVVSLVTLPAACVAWAQSQIARAMGMGLNAQPSAHKKLANLYIIALAISETAAILCLLMGLLLFLGPVPSIPGAVAELGIVCALALPSCVAGIASAFPARETLNSVARYPLSYASLLNVMLLGLSILQTPVILGLIAAIIIKNQAVPELVDGFRILAAGLALAIGTLGPTIGLGFFSQRVCALLGREPYSYSTLMGFIFTSLALIETPILLVFITSIMMTRGSSYDTVDIVRYLAASVAIGLSTFGAGISSARTAASAATVIAQKPETALLVSRSSLLGQTLIDTSPIYGLIVALLLILIR